LSCSDWHLDERANHHAPCIVLDWDSDFFGFRVARVVENRLTADKIGSILNWCAAHRIRCLYFLARSDDLITLRLAEDNRFRFVDLRTTFERSLDHISQAVPGIRLARPDDVPPLTEIARLSHRDSRFYCDTNFSREKCDVLFETWIKKSILGSANAVLVAESGSGPVGYISCNWKQGMGEISLIAVAEQARGAGVGGRLVQSSLRLFHENGLTRVSVVTQGRNVAAQRLYQRQGFLTTSVELWYHAWFPE
jgi:dTDP-4-amino-4,6-dideoxy-D-galactose acyltransferase